MDFTPLPKSDWPTTSSRGFFFWETAQPTSLVGSVIAYKSEYYATTATYLVHCPSPCEVDFPDQTLTHISGSIFKGQYVESKTTTSWNCNLGVHGSSDNYGTCTIAAGNPINTKEATTTTVDYCHVLGQSQQVTFTAGLDKIFSVNPPPSRTGGSANFDAFDKRQEPEHPGGDMTCPSTTRGGHGTTATQSSSPGSTAATTGPKETGAQTTQDASGSQATGTQGPAQTSSKSGAESSGLRRGTVLLLGSALLGAFLSN